MTYIACTQETIVLIKRNKIIELYANLILSKIDQHRTEIDYEKRNEIEEEIITYLEKLEKV